MKLLFWKILFFTLVNSTVFITVNKLFAQITENKDLFTDLPQFIVNRYDSTEDGYLFLSVNKLQPDYLMIIDNYATPVYLKKFDSAIHDLKVQKNGFLTYYSEKSERFYMLDSSFNLIDSFYVSNDYIQNFHDIQITNNGHIFVLGNEYLIVGMDTIVEGGNPDATVIGTVIQEYDNDKNLVFQWRSWDHYQVTDSYVDLTAQRIDYTHSNSIDIDNDGNILLSNRHLNEITKINRISGNIIWRLGGKKNEFVLIGDTIFFIAQHSVSINDNGNIALFDNSNFPGTENSRGVEYQIDELNKTLTLINEYKHSPAIFSKIMGNMQNLQNGNKLIGWGSNPENVFLTEFKPDGTPVYELSSPSQAYSYRSFRFPWKTNLFSSNLDTIDFGIVNYGNSVNRTIIITNNSEKEIELSSYSAHDTLIKITNELPIRLPSKGTKELTIEFKPSRTSQSFNDILTLNYDDADNQENPQRIAIQIYVKGFSQDLASPVISTYPINNSTNIPVNSTIEILFDEPIRNIDNSKLSIDNVKSSIELKKDTENPENSIYNAVIDTINNRINIVPIDLLDYNQGYILNILPNFEDYSDNVIAETIVHFSTETTTNSVSEKLLNRITLHPNPTNNWAVLNSNGQVERIEIVNTDGRIIHRYNKEHDLNFIINLNSQPAGTYIVRIYCKDGTFKSEKLIKL